MKALRKWRGIVNKTSEGGGIDQKAASKLTVAEEKKDLFSPRKEKKESVLKQRSQADQMKFGLWIISHV